MKKLYALLATIALLAMAPPNVRALAECSAFDEDNHNPGLRTYSGGTYWSSEHDCAGKEGMFAYWYGIVDGSPEVQGGPFDTTGDATADGDLWEFFGEPYGFYYGPEGS